MRSAVGDGCGCVVVPLGSVVGAIAPEQGHVLDAGVQVARRVRVPVVRPGDPKTRQICINDQYETSLTSTYLLPNCLVALMSLYETPRLVETSTVVTSPPEGVSSL